MNAEEVDYRTMLDVDYTETQFENPKRNEGKKLEARRVGTVTAVWVVDDNTCAVICQHYKPGESFCPDEECCCNLFKKRIPKYQRCQECKDNER